MRGVDVVPGYWRWRKGRGRRRRSLGRNWEYGYSAIS
jgi:hypothetical protein